MGKMKIASIALAAIGSLGSTDIAHAQDAPSYDWSGVYIAAMFSGDSTDFSGKFYQPDSGFSKPSNLGSVTGASFGGAIGYNFQFSDLIVGIEGRWSGTQISDTEDLNFDSYSQERKISDMVMVGPRIGFAFGRLHAYGTAGFASAGTRVVTSQIDISDGSKTTVDTSDERQTGSYVGAGIEWAFSNRLSLGLEYNRTSLSGTNTSWRDEVGKLTVMESDAPTINTLSARLGIRF